MKNGFFVILIMLVVGCTQKRTEIPKEVLSHDQMVSLLIDIHILEAKVKKLYERMDTSALIYDHYEKMLFDEHGTNREQYELSLDYYIGDNIHEYKVIYEEVVDSLLARQKTNITE